MGANTKVYFDEGGDYLRLQNGGEIDGTGGTIIAATPQSSDEVATKGYVDDNSPSPVNYKGAYNASTNSPDLDTSPSGVSQGDMYAVSVGGTFFTKTVEAGDMLIAKQDNATLEGHWDIIQANLVILDQDDMSSDSATAVPSQQSVKAYVDNNKINDITMTPAPGASNVCNVTFQVKNAAGGDYQDVTRITVYLSDDADGAGLTSTDASGTVVGTTGVDLITRTAKKELDVKTNASGVYVLQITDTSKTQFYPVAIIGGVVVVGSQLQTADYGA